MPDADLERSHLERIDQVIAEGEVVANNEQARVASQRSRGDDTATSRHSDIDALYLRVLREARMTIENSLSIAERRNRRPRI